VHDLPERLKLGAGGGEPNRLLLADALALLGTLPDASVDLAYADPPFATGEVRKGLGADGAEHRYDDLLDDPAAYRAWLEPHLAELHRVLAPTGSLFLHLDHRMSAHGRIALDEVFGRDGFRNEIVWRYGLGGRAPANAFARKHDVLLF
jgi:site-specific DNA-methyltransferase (adenine-specific)